ncbi:dienelactone hydrolase family protein [Parahaliea mediterranea]|uniref:Dienelactone hydrolase family protein n=1 Tax=Parahaliea mediterranea TaxID=651086 RepID=A0A939DHG9_9GAMM|nr:dienelactone hydrolase family protein [Parahaliea mediterranea]MBN7797936.1 dienelactone hydrolase family protein [Parahaliea mediterranea]
MAIQTRLVEYHHEDATFEAYLAWDDSAPGPRPGVAIAHAWGGRSAFEEDKARELAALGYVAVALDVYGKGVRGSSVEENQALMAPLIEDRALLQARLRAGVDCLAGQDRVDAGRLAAIGYCFGGLCVLDLARCGAPVRSVCSFHGLFMPPDNTAGRRIDASVLCLHGYDDPMAQPDSVLALASEMTAAGADWQVHAYGNTVHAFSNPAADDPESGVLYSEVADRRSWQAMRNFLEETLA